MPWMYELSHYGDIAREITRGRYATNFIQPVELAVFEVEKIPTEPPWPVTYRFPLFAVIIALFFKVIGVSDGSLILACAWVWGGFVVILFWIGRSLFPHKVSVAYGAAAVCMVTPVFWRYFVPWGYTCFLFAALILLHNFGLSRAVSGGSSLKVMVALGGLGGMCYWARFNFVLFLPVVLVVLALRYGVKRLPRIFSAYSLGFLVTVLPLVLWRWYVIGGMQSISFWGNLAQLKSELPWLDYRADLVSRIDWSLLCAKWLYNFWGQIDWFPTQYGYAALFPVAVCNLYRAFTSRRVGPGRRYFWGLYLGFAVVQLFVFSALRVESLGRYWVWFAPCLVLAAFEGLVLVLGTVGLFAKRVMIFGWSVFFIAWLYGQSVYFVPPVTVRTGSDGQPLQNVIVKLDKLIPKRALMISNVGVHLAWYLDRPCIDLPNTLDDLKRIVDKYHVRYVFIALWPQGEMYNRPRWQELLRGGRWVDRLSSVLPLERVVRFRDSALFILER